MTGERSQSKACRRTRLQGTLPSSNARRMGCQVEYGTSEITVGQPFRGVDIDMMRVSDTAQTLACVAVFAEDYTRIRNVSFSAAQRDGPWYPRRSSPKAFAAST